MLLPVGDASADGRAEQQAALRQAHTISLATGQPSEVVLRADGTYRLRAVCASVSHAAAAAAATGGRAGAAAVPTGHASGSAPQAALDRACAAMRAWVRACEARLPEAVAEQARRLLEASRDADGNGTVRGAHDAVPQQPLLREAAELAALVGVDAVAARLAAGELDEARLRRWLAQKRRLLGIQPLVAPYVCACAACADARGRWGVHARCFPSPPQRLWALPSRRAMVRVLRRANDGVGGVGGTSVRVRFTGGLAAKRRARPHACVRAWCFRPRGTCMARLDHSMLCVFDVNPAMPREKSHVVTLGESS